MNASGSLRCPLGVLIAFLPFAAAAQSFPSGQVRIVAPYPPGGGTDILGRAIAYKLNERHGTPAIVDNRAGANGTIGAAFVAKAPPDGHTLLVVPAGYAANPAQSLPLIKANRLRALGVTSPTRSPIANHLPAIAEAGLPGFDMTNWYGLLVPSATPPDTIARLSEEVSRILNLPDVRQRLADDGMTVVASTPQAFVQFLGRETAKYTRVIEAAGIKGSL